MPLTLVLQFWGEATVTESMGAAVGGILTNVESQLRGVIEPWARLRAMSAGDADASDRAVALVDTTAAAMVAILQSYVLRAALGHTTNPADYLNALAGALG